MKKPWLAFLLNTFVPGAGLAYLGKWGWAVLNLVALFALGYVLGLAGLDLDVVKEIAYLYALASGCLAMGVTQSMNAKASSQAIGQQAYPIVPQPPAPYFPPQPVSSQALASGARARFCGDCGAEVSASKFCPQCGSQVQAAGQLAYQAAPEEPPPVPNPLPQPTVSSQVAASGGRAKFCGDCGAEVGASKFCPQCGSKVRSVNQCAGCGAVFQSPMKFCPECGAKAGG